MGKGKKSNKRGKKKAKPGRTTKKADKYKDGKFVGRTCPKCGPGVHMGEHKDRYACGSCGYMEKQAKKVEEKKPEAKKE